MKKLLIVLAAALALSVPAFADADPSFSSSFQLTQNNGGAPWYVTTFETDSAVQGEVYFYVKVMDGNSNYRELYAISETSNARAVATVVRVTDNSTSHEYFSCNTSSSGYYFSGRCTYWSAVSSDYLASPEISAFPSTATNTEIASAFTSFLNTPQTPAIPSTFTVPSGNVLYFKVDREQDVRFSATMPVLSSLLGTPTGAWNSGIEFGPAAALPSSGTTFPILSQDPINFAKSATDQNLLGQTKSALAQKHCIVGQYYALYLPYHYGGWLALGSSHVYPDGSVSGGIVGANVTVSGSFAEIKVYPLSEKANGDLLTGSVTLDSGSDDGFASYFDGEISDNGTVTWLNQDGEVSAPSVGGTSYVPEDVSTESIIDQIKNILSSIVSEIKNLFSFGYEAVNTLVGLMRDFVSIFQQLYEWLPSEVYSALISAIIVAITIGVFKVFL